MASRSLVSSLVLSAALCVPSLANARSRGMKALAAGDISIDGVPQEWDGEWRDVTHPHKGGKPDKKDLSGRAIVAYGDEGIYVAADVKDDNLVAGRDYVELMLGVPGGTVASFGLYPGAPGKSRAQVKLQGSPVRGAQIVEAPSDGGYTLEALIPWSAVPKSATIRVGYRGAIFFHDADRGGSVKNILGTADSRSYRELPPISTESELALGNGLLRQRNITHAPRYNLLANVVGDEMVERILVYDRFLVVLGPNYRDGQQYYFRDLGADADKGGVLTLEVKDYTGDGKADLLLKKRVTGEHGSVEVMEILSYHAGAETPDAVFAQETALRLGEGSIVNDVALSGSGSRTTITLKPGKAEGIDSARFERESNTGATPVLVPWGGVASQTWRMQGASFALVDEQSQAPSAPEPPPSRPAPRSSTVSNRRVAPRPSPRHASGAELDKVYALYKKQRGTSGKPRFDMMADLAEDNHQERLLVHGRDLVVMGEGYRGGRGFAAVTLAQFERASDIKSVTTRDVSGDGKDEIVVKGIIRSPLPADVGNGVMARTVVMIYKLKDGGSFDRVFAAEVERKVDNKRVVAKLAFKKGRYRIELRPGRAVGYDERSYPWAQKKVPDQDFEPLLLPWGGVESVRLRYDGDKFVRL